ncbi:MAG: hypothetical protein ACRDTG_10745 [Pseudonocardiaceae bacterium]
MIAGWAGVIDALATADDWLAGSPAGFGVVLLGVVFVGWVISSEHRTRHLVMVIRALRRSTVAGKTRRSGSRRAGGGHV